MNKLRAYLLVGLALALPSGYGLYRTIFFSLPTLTERWVFFFLLAILVCGIMLPFYAAINKYFSGGRIIPTTVVREALATALLVEILLWFQLGRILTPTIIFLSVGGFLLAELVLRTRDKVSHRPGIDDIKNN